MEFGTALYGLLVLAAPLAAEQGAKQVGALAVTEAFNALKSGLSRVTSLLHLGKESAKPLIIEELSAPAIASDAEVARLAEALRLALAALPPETAARYAIDSKVIEGAGLTFRRVQGVRAERITATGDITFEDITAPPGK